MPFSVTVYGHKVSDPDGDWRPSGPGPFILPVKNPGPGSRICITRAGMYTPFLPYVLKRGSHICNLFSGIFFARITPRWCANNFQYSIIWNFYHFHQNSEDTPQLYQSLNQHRLQVLPWSGLLSTLLNVTLLGKWTWPLKCCAVRPEGR